MRKRSYLLSRYFAVFFKKLHAIPVDRKSGNVIRAVRHSLNIVKEGNLLGIFPEGTRCKSGKRVEPRRGVGFVAHKSKAPVLPVALVGVEKQKGFRPPITIIIGSVITAPDNEVSDYMLFTMAVMGKIETMKSFYEKRNHVLANKAEK